MILFPGQLEKLCSCVGEAKVALCLDGLRFWVTVFVLI